MSVALDSLPAADLQPLMQLPFHLLPTKALIRAFGVDYVHVRPSDGGDLYLTALGWPHVRHLLPDRWFTDRRYAEAGQRLAGSTGTVYRVPTLAVDGHNRDLVVKFSRVGQEVPLEIATTFPQGVSPDDIVNARFNSPFEEFGLVMEMRRGDYGPAEIRLLSHRPLAIYAPAQRFDLWQLGRSETRFVPHQLMLKEDQEGLTEPAAIELDIKRDYVLVYSWIKGENAEDYFLRGELPLEPFQSLSPRSADELSAKGFRVLDHKPKHFILRRRRDGGFARRGGKLAYALVDFELLERTETYHQHFKSSRRAKYWSMQSHRGRIPLEPPPAHLAPMRIMDVDYIYGAAPNGGKLWAVGSDAELFDYFLPDRWRRTPRLKLSSINEVYRTRTRDNIHVVYRRSRVGEKPHVEPAYEQGRQIMAYGFNSPFEEFAIAEAMRRAGIATIYPRAIYRTGHESEKADYLADNRRFGTHEMYRLPDDPGQSILSPYHEYYVLWGFWRGIDPLKAQHGRHPRGGVIDVQQALDEGFLTHEVFDQLVERTQRRLKTIGCCDTSLLPVHLLLTFEPDARTFRRDVHGEYELTFSVDALRAYERHLLDEDQYRRVIERQRGRMLNAGFEPLALHGDHLLLAINPDGVLKTDRAGHLRVTHCNFDLVRSCKPV